MVSSLHISYCLKVRDLEEVNKQQDKAATLTNTMGDQLPNTNPHHNKNKLGSNKPKSSYYKKNKNDMKPNGDDKTVPNKPNK